jgi:hypothetical protein
MSSPDRHYSDRNRLPDDDCVMSFGQWCQVNNFSESTGRRLREAGRGPTFVRTSDRRLGVTVRENRRWQNSRALD